MQHEIDQLEQLYGEGRFPELESSARRLTERNPNVGFFWSVLATSLQMQGKDALAPMQTAADLLPGDAVAQANLGDALFQSGRMDAASDAYRRALSIDPNLAAVHNNLGNVFKATAHPKESIECYLRAIEIYPAFAEAHLNLGMAYKDVNQLDAAETSCRQATQLRRDFAEAYAELAGVLRSKGHIREAIENYRSAVVCNPNLVEAVANLGGTLKEIGDIEGALQCYNQALALNADIAEIHCNLGAVLHDLGRFSEARASFHQALAINPDLVDAHSNLLFQLSHEETLGPEELFREHLAFGNKFEGSLRRAQPHHTNATTPQKRLKIGFVSGDLYNHAVANFIDPILQHLAAKPSLEIHVYYNHVVVDEVTQRLMRHNTAWTSVAGLSDEDLFNRIQRDGIDILIDLSGHTSRHRLLVFARKPAPIQISWMGYAGTTGLTAMDYYLADTHFLPLDIFSGQFIEKIVHLPASSPFSPYAEAPEVNALPALTNGFATFGSFNPARKITPSVVKVWSELLGRLPGSRMVIGSVPNKAHGDQILDLFHAGGIESNRISLHPKLPMAQYLELHHLVDMCLDTFPYPGGTTSCHALWMGIPTLTLVGSTPVSRVGGLIQHHVDLGQFICQTKIEYVDRAVTFASHPEALGVIRTNLRSRFAASAMVRSELVANAAERALRIMWERWCAGLPAASFEVT